jgi:hypothetical protein
MVKEAGENALKVGKDLLNSNEKDWNTWKTETLAIANSQNEEFLKRMRENVPLMEDVMAMMGKKGGKSFEAELYATTDSASFQAVVDKWEKKLSGIKPKINVEIGSTNTPQGILNKLLNTGLSFMKDGGLAGTLQRFATGGFVSGPGGPRSDSIFAMLSNGEYVINAKSTSKFLPLLEAINSGKFNTGGGSNTPPSTTMPSIPRNKSDMSDVIINVYPSAGMNESELATKISKVLALQLRKGAIT